MAHSDGCEHVVSCHRFVLVPALVRFVGSSTGCIVPHSAVYPFLAAVVGPRCVGFERSYELFAGYDSRICSAHPELYHGGGDYLGAVINCIYDAHVCTMARKKKINETIPFKNKNA